MQVAKPAVLKPGVTVETLPGPRESDTAVAGVAPLIRGTALILWDPKDPSKKRDAIDTDQITPAADCVSESLDTLDERWKAGSFRYLMPDFRARVHRGETFVIAGDRFAIGSSREMSPAGLKAIAEEVGLEMVIICGNNMGDIFRRNSFNLGLHVVQSPEAVADARDGDEFTFDPVSRKIANVTQGKAYTPVPLSAKEDEIRQSGGIFAVGRREFRPSVERTPAIVFPDPDRARAMSSTAQIVWAHRVDKDAEVAPGATLRVYADLLPASDGTAPFSIHTFNQITGGDTHLSATSGGRQRSLRLHRQKRRRQTDGDWTAIRHVSSHREAGTTRRRATAFSIFIFRSRASSFPASSFPGADSHSRAYGAYGAVGMGVGSTTLGFGWSTGYIYFTMAKERRVTFRGKLSPWVTGKDIVLELLRRWGAKQSQGMSVELVDADKQLPIAFRNTIANMMAEAEALNGIFAPDDITYAWYRAKGITELPYPRFACGADARFEIDEEFSLGDVAPMIAKPFSPGNAFPAEEVARERIEFDKAMIGSCTNGSYDDLLAAALVFMAARNKGLTRVQKELVVFPGSGGVKALIEKPDSRLNGESIADVFRGVGGEIRASWCGPCFGQGPDALNKGERAITSFNRNWQNRMGLGGEGYLASPSVVAASALAGYMAPPTELGLQWDPDKYGV